MLPALRRLQQFVARNPRLVLSLVLLSTFAVGVAVAAGDPSGVEAIEPTDLNVTTDDGGSGSTGPPGA